MLASTCDNNNNNNIITFQTILFWSICVSDHSIKMTSKYYGAMINYSLALYIGHSDPAPLKQEKITIKLFWKNVG